MTTKKISVSFLRNIRELSKVDIIEFFRKRVDSNLQCVEDLGTGTDFCLGMNLLFPNSFDASRIKKGTNLNETERRINFTLLKKAFKTLGIDKNFPMESMARSNFTSNFFFAQWFIRFFEANQESNNKAKDNATNEGTVKYKKGGFRSVPKEAVVNEEKSLEALVPAVSFCEIVTKPQIQNQVLVYDKFGNVSAVKVIRKEETSQVDESTGEDKSGEQIKGLLEVEQLLSRINVERKEYLSKLRVENDGISKSLEHANQKKKYFHNKLNRIEELCDDCGSDTMRSSLRRILYQEGLPL